MRAALNLDISKAQITEEALTPLAGKLKKGQNRLWSGEEELTDWVHHPLSYDREELQKILRTAEAIKRQSQVFIVIGIGGSYLGAKAAISAMGPRPGGIEICFAGQTLSGTYHYELFQKIRDKDFSICVISKSGTTLETCIAFAFLKEAIYDKYGKEEGNKRIYTITDASCGSLREETDARGYVNFFVPSNIGGRYSVLTAVGLLPMAVAGIDIEEMLGGAAEAALESQTLIQEDSAGFLQKSQPARYAAARCALSRKNKHVEIFEYFEPRLNDFSDWLKQLFAESEGKDGYGIYPASLQFSGDLHSVGQFLQEGNQIFFETLLNIRHLEKDMTVPKGLGALSGKSMNQINHAAMEGMIAAHNAAGIPIIKIDIPALNAFYFGQLVYFFETACAIGCFARGLNPFDQPGVEKYKAEMSKYLKD